MTPYVWPEKILLVAFGNWYCVALYTTQLRCFEAFKENQGRWPNGMVEVTELTEEVFDELREHYENRGYPIVEGY